MLYRAFGVADRIPQYWHLPLVVGPDSRRLAKRHGDTRISHYREMGVPASRVLELLHRWMRIDSAERDSIVFTADDDAFLRAVAPPQ
jgi:glutamyl-tRNA synthetase